MLAQRICDMLPRLYSLMRLFTLASTQAPFIFFTQAFYL